MYVPIETFPSRSPPRGLCEKQRSPGPLLQSGCQQGQASGPGSLLGPTGPGHFGDQCLEKWLVCRPPACRLGLQLSHTPQCHFHCELLLKDVVRGHRSRSLRPSGSLQQLSSGGSFAMQKRIGPPLCAGNRRRVYFSRHCWKISHRDRVECMKPSPSCNSCQLAASLVSTLSSPCPHPDEFKANPRHHPQISQYICL